MALMLCAYCGVEYNYPKDFPCTYYAQCKKCTIKEIGIKEYNKKMGTPDGDPDSEEKQLNARYPWFGYLLGVVAFLSFIFATYTCVRADK